MLINRWRVNNRAALGELFGEMDAGANIVCVAFVMRSYWPSGGTRQLLMFQFNLHLLNPFTSMCVSV